MVFLFPIGPESEDLEDALVEWPWVTGLLMAACVVSYVVVLGSASRADRVLRILGWGYDAGRPFGRGVLTYTFLHADGFHLFGNLAFMAGFSVAVERLLGRGKLLAVWVVSGIGAAWFYGLFAGKIRAGIFEIYTPLVGASGAIMGLMGCLLPARPHLRIRLVVGVLRWWQVYSVPAWVICLGYLAKEVWSALTSPGSNVAYTAHIGGIVSGAILAALLPAIDDKLEDWKLAWYRRRAAPKVPTVSSPPDAGPSVVMHPKRGAAAAVSLPRAPPEEPPEATAEALEEAGEGAESELPDSAEVAAPGAAAEVGPPIPDASVADMEVMVDAEGDAVAFGAVEEDASPVAKDRSWVGSLWEADLQERLRRARAYERRPERAKAAFAFYQKLLRDREVPTGYRAYAGARMARMLARGGQYRAAEKLAGRLLKNPLPSKLRAHIQQSGVYAHKQRKQSESGERP